MFWHEDFSGQLIWALQCYDSVNIQGPDESFFEEEMQESSTVPGEGTNQHNEPLEDGEDGSATIPPTQKSFLPTQKSFLLSFKTCWIGGRNLVDDDIIGVLAALPMIDDDNEPAAENLPSLEDLMVPSNNVMGSWSHSGICQ